MAQSRSQRKSHGPYHCGYFGCTQTFTRRTGARRHETTVHGNKKFSCHEPDCNYRGGKRRNDFIRHMKEKHPGHDDHLFVPEDFNNPQGSQSPVANCCQSPEIKYVSQVSGDFSQMPPNITRFNPIDTYKNHISPSIIPVGSFGVPQPYGGMNCPNTISTRPLNSHAFQVVNLPSPESEPGPVAPTEMGNTWSQAQSSTICIPGSTLPGMTDTSVENEFATFDGEYDLSQYGQPMNDCVYRRW